LLAGGIPLAANAVVKARIFYIVLYMLIITYGMRKKCRISSEWRFYAFTCRYSACGTIIAQGMGVFLPINSLTKSIFGVKLFL
jgi:hypothetical protein